MAFIISGKVIRDKADYLKYENRKQLNVNVRATLKDDLIALSKHTNQPVGKMIDVWILMLQSDSELLDKFLEEVKKY